MTGPSSLATGSAWDPAASRERTSFKVAALPRTGLGEIAGLWCPGAVRLPAARSRGEAAG